MASYPSRNDRDFDLLKKVTENTADIALGAIQISPTGVSTVNPTSTNRTIAVVVDGVTYYLAAKTTNN